MKEINLEEILLAQTNGNNDPITTALNKEGWVYKLILKFGKEVALQTLQLAVENATVDIIDWEDNTERIKNLPALPIYGVDSNSILKLKNKIK
jgi:hypothetical protein